MVKEGKFLKHNKSLLVIDLSLRHYCYIFKIIINQPPLDRFGWERVNRY